MKKARKKIIKKIMKKMAALGMAFVIICTPVTGRVVYAESDYFSLVEDNFQIMVAETDFIEVELVADSRYKETDIQWVCADPTIVSVDQDGIIAGISEGTTTVTGTMPDGSSNTCTITVSGYMNDEDNPYLNQDNHDPSLGYDTPEFTSLTLPRKATIFVGGEEWVKVSYEPSGENGADEGKITWQSSNPKVATVEDGLVTGIKSGTVQIIAMTPNGITATCTVTVQKPSIKLNKNNVKLKVGKRFSIKADCNPDTEPVFKSQNKKIANVTVKGVIKAVKKGKTVIVVKANGVSKKVNVTVVKNKQ